MLAITGSTGKLGGATLSALLAHNLVPPSQLVLCTSSDPKSRKFHPYREQGIQIRFFDFNSPDASALAGCSKLLLVSTPAIALDFNNAPPGQGREKHHIAAIDAAFKAGVKHVYYTSLAFGSNSDAGVMTAHLRSEAYLKELEKQGLKSTVLREGLYNESWPLYLGYYFDLKGDEREEVVLAGDGKISWTAIADLGLATAIVLADEGSKWEGKTFYLSNTQEPKSLKEIAALVGSIKGKKLEVKIVSREEYVEHYVGSGRPKPDVEWWSTTYEALNKGECEIKDTTLEELFAAKRVKPKSVEDTVREMLSA